MFDFIARLIQHIPDVNFCMIRYYGVLANRVRSKLLPILYRFLGQTEKGQLILPSYESKEIPTIFCKKPKALEII